MHPESNELLLVANTGSNTLTLVEDLLTGPPARPVPGGDHPLVGRPMPPFALRDFRTGEVRTATEWAERKYIVNFFASW